MNPDGCGVPEDRLGELRPAVLPSTPLGASRAGGESGGIYVLVLRHSGRPFRARVGALGTLSFKPGFYCYVGSARGGLKARLMRHLRKGGKRKRWHVDFLRERTEPVGALCWAGEGADECLLSRAVGRLAQGSVPGFGCSDCRCRSHLYYFTADPTPRLRRLSLPGQPSKEARRRCRRA